MLFVKTEVKPSGIQGLGLFAAQDIAEGTIIAQYKESFGYRCTQEEFEQMPIITKNFLFRYAWRNGDGDWIMDLDDSRFMNHSFHPNMKITLESHYTAIAARAIKAGEELTENYGEFDPDFKEYGKDWT